MNPLAAKRPSPKQSMDRKILLGTRTADILTIYADYIWAGSGSERFPNNRCFHTAKIGGGTGPACCFSHRDQGGSEDQNDLRETLTCNLDSHP